MKNSHLKNRQQNRKEKPQSPATHVEYKKPEVASVLQREVPPKNKIVLTHAQQREAAWLFKQYGRPKPRWLRQQFLINQYRRKQLNDVLAEAGCGSFACGKLGNGDDWACTLHVVWHEINRRPPCSK